MPPEGTIAADEEQRLAAVRRYDILDTPPDGAFDRITSLAARFLDVPISTITIVDHDRIWFKSAHGIEVEQIGRDPGLCSSAVLRYEPHVVTDAAIDPRTLTNPLVVGELGLRFYVGIPLRTRDGYNLGTLNVIDVEPRPVSDEEIAVLEDLAAVVVDELELRLAARTSVRTEAATEAARFRDRLLAALSHEMRTPLAMILGLLDLAGAGDERKADLLPAMRRQVRHLERLVKQFLDFTSIEDGALPVVEKRPTHLADLVEDLPDVFAEVGAVVVEAEPGAPLADVNPDRVRQTLLELVTNALRFAPGRPATIRVAPGVGGEVRIDVVDEGPGIPAGDLQAIFEASVRSPSSYGTGIGLYVARALAESQGGRIEVSSTPGEGSTFTLVVPAAVDR